MNHPVSKRGALNATLLCGAALGRIPFPAIAAATLCAGAAMFAAPSRALAQTMTFEGLQNGELVNNFYNGGSGSKGSTGGPNIGVQWVGALAGFAPNGVFNNVANEPTKPTVMGFLSGPAPVMNLANGFKTGFSFEYAAPFSGGEITVWSGLNGTGAILANLTLPTNGTNPNFPQNYSNWTPIGVSFDGTAESVTFGGTANFIVFDDVTVNSINPGLPTINTTQPYFLATALGSTLEPVFQGGALRMDQANGVYAQNFTLDGSNTNTIDQFGNASIFTGVFSDAAPGAPGNIIIANSGTGGSVTFSGVNTYTGSTTINQGATFIIAPGGSITNQSAIINSGNFIVDAGANVTVGGITNNITGSIANFGVITDALNNSGLVVNNAAYNADVNNFATGAIVNNGTWTGSLLSNLGFVVNSGVWNAATFANNPGGTVTTTGTLTATTSIDNGGTFNAQGILATPLLNNTGLFKVTGPLASAITTFNNSGTVSLVDGLPTGVFTATNFNSLGGKLAIDVNPTAATADKLVVTNALSGATTVQIHPVGGGALISSPIPIVVAGTLAPGANVIAAGGSGLVNYNVLQTGGTFSLISLVNTSAASATPTGIDAILTSLNTGFFQNASAFIAEPPNPAPNQINGGPWIRLSGGQNDVNATTSAQNSTGLASAASKVRTDFNGFQTGIDLGVANVENSGWNTHLGVTAGQVNLTTNDLLLSGVNSAVQVPFIGLYGAVTGHGFYADFQVREDFYDLQLTNPMANLTSTNLNGKAFGVNGSAGYRFDLPQSWFVEPSGALIYSQLHVDPLRVNIDPTSNTFGELDFNAFNSLLGRLGVRVGTSYVLNQFQLALQPFGTASVWREFEGDTHTNFLSGNVGVPLAVTRIGTFGQLGLGVSGQVLNSGLLGFVRADYRFGGNISGYAVVGGMRYQF